ncbi:MAG TPA: HNH endonuclease signature motif containing protein, partial [Stenomitos sp.]
MSIVDMYEASIILGVPEFLVRDFVSYGFNQRKLKAVNTGSAAYQFSIDEVQDFRSHLEAQWPGDCRSSIPKHIERYLKYEAQGVCALCQTQQPHYEYAHIQPWAKSRCHSPHNILYLCLNCHTSHGNDIKLLSGLKEEKLRRIRLLDSDFIYDCSKDMISGEAIYVFNGSAYRADATDEGKIATGFIKTKVG